MTSVTNNSQVCRLSAPESHLKSYIDYYKGLVDPGYAVLVTGSWGAGKTHQIKQILKQEEYYYVSLFGAQNPEEIYSSVYAKMFPVKAFSKGVANSTNGVTVGPIAVGGLISSLAGALLKDQVDSEKVLVFDDLERSRVSINDLLGVFNNYVEHHKCRVIVLAHDKKAADGLSQTKEKVFGQTIEVVPQTEEAFESFLTRLPDEQIRQVLKSMGETILGVFSQSNAFSLRILKHSIEDLSRLLGLLDSKYKEHHEAMLDLVSFFLALSLEVRSGNLSEKDLLNRHQSIMAQQIRRARETLAPSAIVVSHEKYPAVDLGNTLLSDKVLVDILIKGVYSQTDLQESLNGSLYFTSASDLPAWQAFINFDSISDAESQKAASDLKSQFDGRSVTVPGELLHLFSLRFLFVEMDLISGGLDEVELECRQYLDDLRTQEKIEPYMGLDIQWGEGFVHAYKGFGYWVEESYRPHFSRVLSYFKDVQSLAAVDQFPKYAKHLLTLLATDGEGFAKEISLTFSGDNTFASIPVLQSIKPIDFVQEWMGSPASNWRDISRGLEQRYNSGQLERALSREVGWLKDVVELMEVQRKKARGIRRKRIERVISPGLRAISESV